MALRAGRVSALSLFRELGWDIRGFLDLEFGEAVGWRLHLCGLIALRFRKFYFFCATQELRALLFCEMHHMSSRETTGGDELPWCKDSRLVYPAPPSPALQLHNNT